MLAEEPEAVSGVDWDAVFEGDPDSAVEVESVVPEVVDADSIVEETPELVVSELLILDEVGEEMGSRDGLAALLDPYSTALHELPVLSPLSRVHPDLSPLWLKKVTSPVWLTRIHARLLPSSVPQASTLEVVESFRVPFTSSVISGDWFIDCQYTVDKIFKNKRRFTGTVVSIKLCKRFRITSTSVVIVRPD